MLKSKRFALITVVGVLGLAATACPVPPGSGGGSASSPGTIAVGSSHSCALLDDGGVACWGDNNYGQLGDGSSSQFSLTPVEVSGISDAVYIGAGYGSSCAVLAGGSVRCWGANGHGQLGNGTTTYSREPVDVSGISNAVAVTVGNAHACAQLADGTGRCWGRNNYGQLGDGTSNIDAYEPVEVSGLSDAVAISAGNAYTCAVVAGGAARCWGANGSGQLGDGTTSSAPLPVAVTGLSDAVDISAGEFHACAVLSSGNARCWGLNDHGQLGDGSTTGSNVAVAVTGISNAAEISAGSRYSCAVLSDGTARCWGSDYYEQLGNGTGTSDVTVPEPVAGLSDAATLAVDGDHSCASLGDGAARCWGSNNAGKLGDGTIVGSDVPVAVTGLP